MEPSGRPRRTPARTLQGDWAAVGAFLRSRRERISAVPLVIFVLVCSPILFTPYRDDDLINRTLAELIGAGRETALGHFLQFTRQWMENEGRFFPGSVGWGTLVFSSFSDRLSYKSLLFLLSLAACAVTSLFAAWLVGRSPFLSVPLALGAGWALRFAPFDGLDSFAGLLPLTICLALGSALLLSRARGWLQALGAVGWLAAITTYEMAVLMAPALVAALVFRKARRGAVIMAALTAADLVLVAFLRRGVTPAPGYSLNLDPESVGRTFIRQAGSALPLAQWWFPGAPELDFPVRAGLIWALAFAVAGLAFGLARRAVPERRARTTIPLAFVGASAWLLPSLLTGMTVRWQQELQPGTGYISVVWGYVGVSLLMVAAMEAVAARAGARWLRPLAVAASMTVAVLAALTFVSNLAVAGSLSPPPT